MELLLQRISFFILGVRIFYQFIQTSVVAELTCVEGQGDGQDMKSEHSDGKERTTREEALNDIFIFQSSRGKLDVY